MTAYETAMQDAEALRRCPEGNWPDCWRSPSQRKMHRPDLEREVSIIWLMPESEARHMPWARERFGRPSPHQQGLIARSVDARGRTIRFWVHRPDDGAAYLRLLQSGAGTCPIEAIWPPSITVGQPAQPAHPHLLPQMWQAIAASEGTPVELPAANMQSTPQKLAEIDSAFWEGMRPPQ